MDAIEAVFAGLLFTIATFPVSFVLLLLKTCTLIKTPGYFAKLITDSVTVSTTVSGSLIICAFIGLPAWLILYTLIFVPIEKIFGFVFEIPVVWLILFPFPFFATYGFVIGIRDVIK